MNKIAFIFPGQASQFPGMGKELYATNSDARNLYDEANALLGFPITEIMFEGSEEQLKETRITQPSVFIHSVVNQLVLGKEIPYSGVAGHSLGEFSALVASGVLTFTTALELVRLRAEAMQHACEINPGTMAAIVGLEDEKIEEICEQYSGEIVVPANYNCPGQLVISGSLKGIDGIQDNMIAAGAKRFIVLAVGGAFHSPLMEPAAEELAMAIERTEFKDAICPVYQNITANPEVSAAIIKNNLLEQLTSPVLWTQSMQNMIADGFNEFYEIGGNGTVLSGFMKRIKRDVKVNTL